jgi:hypothetical protein
MTKLHSKTVLTFQAGIEIINVDLCWEGDDPANDPDAFYDFFDHDGNHLNSGEPLHCNLFDRHYRSAD